MKISWLLFIVTLFITGCAQRPAPQMTTWQQHQQQLETLHDWAFSGKIAIITPEERHSLNIHWQQTGDYFHIRLSTFLGSTILDVQKNSLGTQITDDKGKVYWGDDAQVLIAQLSGLILPIDLLQQWIKGNPNSAPYLLNENNNVVSLTSMDPKNTQWSVSYNQYENTQGINLPYNIQLQRLDLRLKFAISEWQIE